ncbi:MAG: extracellular solute-binding protein [Clostridia bacterium]|nr:extracellular solute-binding protein [Clostridia bacterium]
MRKTTCKKLTCLGLSLLMCSGVFPSLISAADTTEKTEKSALQEISESFKFISYAEYKEKYADVARGTDTVKISAVDYKADETDADVKVVSDYQGKSGKALQIPDAGKVTWEFNVPKAGMYAVAVDFCSVTDKTTSIERTLYINGTVPCSEARYLLMKKTWRNNYIDGRFEKDFNGNELRPTSYVDHQWGTYEFIDSNTYYANPFEFYFEKGVNTLSLEAVREDVVISEIRIYPYEDNISYEEYVSGKSEAAAEPIHIHAELPSATSDYTVYPIYDRKSPITEPQDASKIMLNTIGSEKWTTPGQWVEYEFEVASAGLYEIVLRYRQNELPGMYTSRKIYIDGEIPFEEANYAKFNYDTEWQVEALNNGADTFQFYFEPGVHTVRLEVTLGEMGDVVRQVSEIMTSVNDDYLEILKLTGSSPDSYRDYGFGRVLPDVVEDLVLQHLALEEVIGYVEGMANIKSQSSATLDTISRLLLKMGTDEDEIAPNLTELKSQVGTLGEWINDVKKQPIEIDYINIQPASAEKPKANANFFSALWFEIKSFIASFFTDYNSLGGSGEVDENASSIEVWYTGGRDQAQIIRNLMDNDFMPTTGINANLKLVAGGTLLPSVLAGVGPEVALPGTGADPIQYAIRSAVLALNPEAYADQEGDDEETKAYNAKMREALSTFDDVTSRFTEAAMIPITLYGKTYALPDTQTWNMMFYRTDIIAELGMEIPETWDDLLAMIPVLQFNNMEIGMSQDYQMYMYQMGEELWADDGMRINLDSNLSLESFETMCNMFTQYSLPVTYDFANRFRTGEMPICIQPYTSYNNIIIFATEIAGLWDFGPIPGFLKDDGTVDNTSMSSVTALVMMAGTEDVAAAWKFMDWYTDSKFQVDYSNELVALLGPAAKNATANMEALEELPWTSHEYGQLMKQMDHTEAVVAYPGSYILARYTNFAFLDAYNNNADPVESLLSYINTINKEITRKRIEFELETLEIGETLASKRLGQAAAAIDELDDATKSSAPVAAVTAAIASENIEEIRNAASGLNTSDAVMAEIAGYLTDAANALESYLN